MKRQLICVVVFVVLHGCASVKLEHVQALQKAIVDERKAVTVRPGFEKDVAAQRAEEDELIATMLKACR